MKAKVKICKGMEDDFPFPYGHMTQENKTFLESHIGDVFEAERIGINGYELKEVMPNGKKAFVHIYNAMEVSQ